MSVNTRGAVLSGFGGSWDVREIRLESPGANEILVCTRAAGICHSGDRFSAGDCMTPAASVTTADERFATGGRHRDASVVPLADTCLFRDDTDQAHSAHA